MDKKIEKLKIEKNSAYACSNCGSINIAMTQNPAKIYFRELKEVYCKDCKFEGMPVLKKIKSFGTIKNG